MNDNALTTRNTSASDIERVVIMGDLSALKPEERLQYYQAVCQSVGLNPLTKPFDYITLNGKMVLYARKDATDQLRSNRGVSIVKLEREKIEDIYTVTAYAEDERGRSDSSIGAVSISNLRGDALANAIMKAETKAKRRVTLSICGLGLLDETELETIPANVIQRPTVTVVNNTAPVTPKLAQIDEKKVMLEMGFEDEPVETEQPAEVAPKTASSKGEDYANMSIKDLAGRHAHYSKLARAGDAEAKATADYIGKLITQKREAAEATNE